MMQSSLIALQFVTRLTVKLDAQPNEKKVGRSLRFYPLIGLIIGSILVTLGWILNHAQQPHLISVM